MASGRLFLPGWMPARDSNGDPIPNVSVSFYQNETDVLASVFVDETLTIPLPNPVAANSSGRFPEIYASDAITYSASVEAPYGPAGQPFTFDGLQVSQAADIAAANLAQGAAEDAETALQATLDAIEAATQTGGGSAAVAGALAGAAAANLVVAGKANVALDNVTPSTGRAALNVPFKNAPVTSNFLASLGGVAQPAEIVRLGDRVFIGGANANDASFPNVTKDWYTTFEIANGRANGIIVSAQSAILTNDSSGARVGLVVAARTSSVSADTGYVQSMHVTVVQDRTSSLIPATAGYIEAWRTNDACGAVQGLEIDTINKGAYNAITPYLQSTKQDVALQLAAGGEFSVFDSSAAINVRNNGSKFGAALMVGHDSIVGSDGATGTGHAIQLARQHQITWYNMAGDITSGVFGGVTSASFRTRLAFLDTGAAFLSPTDSLLARFDPVATATNYFSFQAATMGGSPTIAVAGSDTNVSLRLVGQGTGIVSIGSNMLAESNVTIQGVLRIGAFVSNADAPVIGYTTVQTSDGATRKLAIIS